MVEDFTKTEEEAYCSGVTEMIVQIDEDFEKMIRHDMQYLAKEPRQYIVDNIMDYSKSLRKN